MLRNGRRIRGTRREIRSLIRRPGFDRRIENQAHGQNHSLGNKLPASNQRSDERTPEAHGGTARRSFAVTGAGCKYASGVSSIDYPGPHPSLASMNPVVASDKLKRAEVWAEDDESVHWAGAFAVYGGHGTTASSTIVYEIEPGKRLGWHTDATEETQYIIAGTGELQMEDGSTYRVGQGVFLPFQRR